MILLVVSIDEAVIPLILLLVSISTSACDYLESSILGPLSYSEALVVVEFGDLDEKIES